MTQLICIALTTGLLSGIWAWMADSLHLLSWAGFLGCTSFFATKGDVKALAGSIATNFTGVFWAMVIIYSATKTESHLLNYMVIAVVSFFMCAQAKQKWLAFIPGTFIGACTTFAASGDWKLAATSLFIGAFMGYAMKHSGLLLHKGVVKKHNAAKGLETIS